MGKQRKPRTADEKAELVLATSREDVTVAEVARERSMGTRPARMGLHYGVDKSPLHTNGAEPLWKEVVFSLLQLGHSTML